METEREMERRKGKIEKVCTDNFLNILSYVQMGFPGGSEGKETACNARDLGSIPGSGRSPGGGKGSPLQYSCLENPMDRGAWRATVHGSQRVRQN